MYGYRDIQKSGSEIIFLYKNTNHIIKELEEMDTGYMIGTGGNIKDLKLKLNRVGDEASTLIPSFTDGTKGEWVKVTVTLGGTVAEQLNATEPYGPVKLHLD